MLFLFSIDVVVTLTQDMGDVMRALDDITIGGNANVVGALKTAQVMAVQCTNLACPRKYESDALICCTIRYDTVRCDAIRIFGKV